MKIYKLTSNSSDLVYVGKTIRKLIYRLSSHRCNFHNGDSHCSSRELFEAGGEVSIELIEETEDEEREAFWIKELNACNTQKLTGRTHNHNDKVNCVNCGCLVSYGNRARHKKSKKCQNHSPVH